MSRKQIKLSKDNIRLSLVYPVYKQKTTYTKMPDGELIPERKEKLVKEITVQKWFKKDAITSVEEYITSKNKVAKSRSIVHDKYTGKSFATFHSPEDIMQITEQTKHPIGFKK